MSKPEVTPENWREVYDFYEHHQPSRLALRAVHRVASLVYYPKIEYMDEAKQQIKELLDAETRLFIVSNHLHVADQFPVAAMMQRGPMRRVIGNTMTLAKQPYFTGPWRGPIDATGGVPVYREQDIDGALDRREFVAASKALFGVVARRVVNDGTSVFLFPEGTRNSEDPRKLGDIKSGIGRMVLACLNRDRDVPLAIVPLGLWPGDDTLHSFTPAMAVGEPLTEFTGTNTAQITRATAEAMGQALYYAQEM